jgi:hypothetical protein
MLILGVDPGLTGALSLIAQGRGLLECADIPTCENGTEGNMKRWIDVGAVRDLVGDWAQRHDFARETAAAVIERPIATPQIRGREWNTPVQTIATQFETFGVLRGVLGGRCNQMCFVNPREWKTFYGLAGEKAKNEARRIALALYEDAPVARVKDHNRAESILIGHYWLRTKA